jgi:hypothetical protein
VLATEGDGLPVLICRLISSKACSSCIAIVFDVDSNLRLFNVPVGELAGGEPLVVTASGLRVATKLGMPFDDVPPSISGLSWLRGTVEMEGPGLIGDGNACFHVKLLLLLLFVTIASSISRLLMIDRVGGSCGCSLSTGRPLQGGSVEFVFTD